MDIICQSCSTKLTIPNEKVPKDAVFKVTCPKCQTKNQVNTKGEAGAMLSAGVAPRPGQKEAEPASSLEEIPEEMIPIPTTEEDFVEDQRLAMICFEQPQILVVVRAALEGLGYTVHVPAKADDAVQRLRQNRYEVLLLHEDYGGSPENNLVLLTIQPMVMTQRRHMCVRRLPTRPCRRTTIFTASSGKRCGTRANSSHHRPQRRIERETGACQRIG